MTPLGCAPVWHPPPWNSAKTGQIDQITKKNICTASQHFLDWLHRFPVYCLPTLLSISTFLLFFSFFLFSTIYLLVLCGRLSWPVSAFECTLKQHLVSYRSIIRRRQISGALHTPSDSTEQQGHWGIHLHQPSPPMYRVGQNETGSFSCVVAETTTFLLVTLPNIDRFKKSLTDFAINLS